MSKSINRKEERKKGTNGLEGGLFVEGEDEEADDIFDVWSEGRGTKIARHGGKSVKGSIDDPSFLIDEFCGCEINNRLDRLSSFVVCQESAKRSTKRERRRKRREKTNVGDVAVARASNIDDFALLPGVVWVRGEEKVGKVGKGFDADGADFVVEEHGKLFDGGQSVGKILIERGSANEKERR